MDEHIHKYFLDDLDSESKEKLLLRLKTDSDLRKEFSKQQNLYALLDLVPNQDDYTRGLKSYTNFISSKPGKKKNKRVDLLYRVLKNAAAIAILISTTWWTTTILYDHKINSETNQLYVPAGQRACLTLHDGTTVWLNAKSTLTYPSRFTGDKREVSLIGEAFFDVSKDPSAPFYVSARDVTVKVLGTEFNVLAYPESEYITASLLKGIITVTSAKDSHEVTLSPNQEAIIKDGKMDVSEIKQHAYFLWKDGIYSFEQERFASIIKKLELYYDTKIIVKDESILEFIYTGKFRQQDGIEEILRIIQKIHNFKINRDRENNIITLSK